MHRLPLLAVALSVCWTATLGANDRQSPIDLYASVSMEMPSFVFSDHFDQPASADVATTNNGHTLQVTLPSGYTVTGGGLPYTYIPLQFHLHWDDEGYGSEHAMFGQKFPAELHLVMVREGYNASYAVNSGEGDALAVLGFFIEEINDDNPKWAHAMTAIKAVENYDVNNDTTIPAANFVLSSLLYNRKSNYGDYFRYDGGLTTPTFNEVVLWTVFTTPISWSSAQLAILRNLTYHNGSSVAPNFRAVQSVNARQVYGVGEELLAEQSRRVQQAGSTTTQAPQGNDGERGIPESVVIVVFVLMALLCIGCVCALVFMVINSRSKSEK